MTSVLSESAKESAIEAASVFVLTTVNSDGTLETHEAHTPAPLSLIACLSCQAEAQELANTFGQPVTVWAGVLPGGNRIPGFFMVHVANPGEAE